MTFDSDKNTFLAKADKSVKGSVDQKITDLCNKINNLEDYYTTSSCSGRIVLIKISSSGKKHESEWLFTSHNRTDSEQIKEKLKDLPEEEVWFRFEPFIIHINARTIDAANELLKITKELGIKRSGIISLGNKIMLEIIGTEHIEAIISKNNKLLVDDNYIETLTTDANKKLNRNWENIKRISEELKKL
jgi:tRNA wybutosine-synthesizing protein 3